MHGGGLLPASAPCHFERQLSTPPTTLNFLSLTVLTLAPLASFLARLLLGLSLRSCGGSHCCCNRIGIFSGRWRGGSFTGVRLLLCFQFCSLLGFFGLELLLFSTPLVLRLTLFGLATCLLFRRFADKFLFAIFFCFDL